MPDLIVSPSSLLADGMNRLREGQALDPLEVAQLADLLEEAGSPEVGYAVRWMHARGHRPAMRTGRSIRKPWAWFMNGACLFAKSDQDVMEKHPGAVLDTPLFVAMGRAYRASMALYHTWDEAVADLAAALCWLERIRRVER